MKMHAWSEHVVHVELLSRDEEIGRTAARFLEQRFRQQEVEVAVDPGVLRIHSDLAQVVSAEQVVGALAEASVRAHAVYDRIEWSVTEV